MTRISKAPEERRRDFLTAAKRLFSQKGYEKTSVSDIVTEVGVAQGLFYYYFRSKQECFEAVIEEEVEHCIKKIRDAIEKTDEPVERIRRIFKMMMEYLEQIDEVARKAGAKTRARFDELEGRIGMQVMEEATQTLCGVIEYGNERGDFHCTYPLPTAQMITMGLLSLMAGKIGKAREVLSEYEPVVQDLCGRLLGVEHF